MLLDILTKFATAFGDSQSLKNSPDMKLSLYEQKEIEEDISSLYDEYHQFICMGQYDRMGERLPQYKLHLKKSISKTEYACVEYEDGIYHLYVSDTAYYSNVKKEIIFHEFTHIYDREYLFAKWRFHKDAFHYKTGVYTEVHAEQVKFLYMLGCKTVNDTITADQNSIVYNIEGKSSSFYEYLKSYREEMLKASDLCKQHIKKGGRATEEMIESISNGICYYIGALSIYCKYCTYNVDMLRDLTELSKFWEQGIKVYPGDKITCLREVIDLYCDRDIYTLSKVEIADSGTVLLSTWNGNRNNLK